MQLTYIFIINNTFNYLLKRLVMLQNSVLLKQSFVASAEKLSGNSKLLSFGAICYVPST